MNIDYLNRVGTAHNNFKTHEMRLNEENQNLKKENERLKERLDIAQTAYLSVNEKNDKAIEYIENYLCSDEYIQSDINSIANAFVKLVDILKGVDK